MKQPAPQPPTTSSLAFRLILGGAATAALALVVTRPDRVSLEGALCAGLAIMVSLIPLARNLSTPNEGRLPILAVMALFHAVFFALPVFTIDLVWPDGTPIKIYTAAPEIKGYGIETTGVLLLGIVALVAGMALARRIKVIHPLPLGYGDSRNLRRAMWAILALHFSFFAFPALAHVTTFGQLSKPSGILAFGLALAALRAGQLVRPEAGLVFGILLPLRLGLGLKDGALFDSLLPLVGVVIMALAIWPRLVALMIPLVLVGALFYGPLQFVRQFALYRATATAEKLGMVAEMLPGYFTTDKISLPYQGKTILGALAWPLLKRIDQMTVLSLVIEQTPSTIEPWHGHTLKPLLTGAIPRALWPGKPEERVGHEFGVRYRLIQSSETGMSVNLPWLTEFYANFMLPGLGIGMFAVGLVMGALDRLLNPGGPFGPRTALAAALLVPLTFPESNLSLMASNLPTVGLALWVMLWLLLRRWKPSP